MRSLCLLREFFLFLFNFSSMCEVGADKLSSHDDLRKRNYGPSFFTSVQDGKAPMIKPRSLR